MTKKKVDYENHGRLTLRYLSKDVIPVSMRLKNNIRTPKNLNIIRKTKRQLMNGRIRSINNTIELCRHQRGTCMIKLSIVLDQPTLTECTEMMNRINKSMHKKVLD